MQAIVCGAGIAGLTASWWLGRDGWDVLVLERSAGLREAGYMIDFFGSGYDVAERMGLLQTLQRLAYPIGDVVTVNAAGARVTSTSYALFAELLGGRLLDLMRGDLERTLYDALPGTVAMRHGTSIDAIEAQPDGVTVTLTDGTTERADLLIGADGIHSRVRALVFGDERRYLDYLGYHTAAYVFEDADCSAALGGGVQLIASPRRHAGLYPIRDGKVAAFFVYDDSEPRIGSNACLELRQAYAGVGGLLPRTLAHCGSGGDIYADVVAQVAMPAWTSGRVALVGDACCAVSLVAGQGASIAMGSAYVLARALRSRSSIHDALAAYERTVRPVVERKQASGRRTADWLFPRSRWRLAARNAVVSLSRLRGLERLLRPVFAAGQESLVAVGDAAFADQPVNAYP